MCREKIKASLQGARASDEGVTAISLMERALTIRTLPELNAASGYRAIPDAQSSRLSDEAGLFLPV